jgi:hypothetical protein
LIVNLSSGSYFAIAEVVAVNKVYHNSLRSALITKLVAITVAAIIHFAITVMAD